MSTRGNEYVGVFTHVMENELIVFGQPWVNLKRSTVRDALPQSPHSSLVF